MAKNARFFVAVFCLCVGLYYIGGSHGIKQNTIAKHTPSSSILTQSDYPDHCFKRTLISQIGVVECGENRGHDVERYLAYTGLTPGFAWCTAFQSWCIGQCDTSGPKTAWSPALFPKHRVVYTNGPWPKDQGNLVYGIFNPSKGRIAHTGGVIAMLDDRLIGVEGNTNDGGGSEGDRVLKKIRPKSTIHAIAKY